VQGINLLEIRLRIFTSDKKNNRFFDCLFIAYFCLARSTPFFYVSPINHNLTLAYQTYLMYNIEKYFVDKEDKNDF